MFNNIAPSLRPAIIQSCRIKVEFDFIRISIVLSALLNDFIWKLIHLVVNKSVESNSWLADLEFTEDLEGICLYVSFKALLMKEGPLKLAECDELS